MDEEFLEGCKLEMMRCRKVVPGDRHWGPPYFIEEFCYWREDRTEFQQAFGLSGNYFRPKLFDFQLEYIWARVREQHIHATKTRGVGLTWLELSIALWSFLFEEGGSYLYGSRKEHVVDGPNENSAFAKIMSMYRRLPYWMKPAEESKVHTYLHFVNPGHPLFGGLGEGNYIVGEAGHKDFGRQGRYKRVCRDEFAAWSHSEASAEASAESSNAIASISTPKGYGNAFGRMKKHQDELEHQARERGASIVFMSFHWTQHPYMARGKWYDSEKGKYRSPWYDRKCIELGNNDALIAQELDMSFERSVSRRTYVGYDPAIHLVSHTMEFNPDLPLGGGMDPGGNTEAWVMAQWTRGAQWKCYVIGEIAGSGLSARTAKKVVDWRDALRQRHNRDDIDFDIVFGDPSGASRVSVSDLSVFDVYKQYGIVLRKPGIRGPGSVDAGVNIVNRLFNEGRILISPACKHLNEALMEHRGDPACKHKHWVDALRYLIVGKFSPRQKKEPKAYLL